MALWIAGYADGLWQERQERTRYAHKLPLDPWFLQRLEAAGGKGTAKHALAGLHSKHDTRSDVIIFRGLVKLGITEGDDHCRGWRTSFSDEAQLLMHYMSYMGHLPADAYSMTAV